MYTENVNNKRKIIVVCAFILLILVLIFLSKQISNPPVFINNHKLSKSIKSITAESVILNEIVPFEWDMLYTFEPYTSRDEIEKTIGFHSNDIKENNINEGVLNLIFVKNEEVVANILGYPSNLGYNISFDSKISYDEKAEFEVSNENGVITLLKKTIIYRLERDLTNDDIPDIITSQLKWLAGDNSISRTNESLISSGEYIARVTIYDGASKKKIFDKDYSADRIEQGLFALVTDGSNWYVLENVCNEQMGYGSYNGSVCCWRNEEKVIVDEFDASFVIGLDAAHREYRNGKKMICRKDIIDQYKNHIEKWIENSELIVSCDISGNYYREKTAYVTSKDTGIRYDLTNYFDGVWKRASHNYEASIFEGILDNNGILIDDSTLHPTVRYYFSDDDKIIACTTGDDYSVDINNDGKNELICNLTYGDGGRSTDIYYIDNNKKIYKGNLDDLLDEEYDNHGNGNLYSKYLPDEGVVEIHYWKDELNTFKVKKYEIDMNKISFFEYKR